ncbi:MAG: zinc-ribbon and DUF3426 domain-containing protein [Steroidobacterales bacterium]
MFTVCPKCTLTLAVTAADLRTGQGYVRCGRCLNVFNALLALSEEPASAGEPAPVYSQADPASSSQITAALATYGGEPPALATYGGEPAVAVEEPPEAHVHEASDSVPRTHLATERSSDGAIENESSLAEGTGSFETIVLEGDAITQTEEFVPEESIDSEIAALTQRLNVAAQSFDEQSRYDIGASMTSGAAAAEASGTHDSPLQQAAALGAELDAEDGIVAATPPHRSAWTAGCAVLVLLLALQAINHWRDALAAAPTWSAPINRLYASIGVPLDPHWNLAAYDIRQQGAASDPADSRLIHVRLSLANREQRAQPVPILRLTLLDRYGKAIAARDLTPAEYWPAGHVARGFLAPDERIDSEVAVRDPTADSASFELDACLRSPRGIVRCAGDTSVAAAPIP